NQGTWVTPVHGRSAALPRWSRLAALLCAGLHASAVMGQTSLRLTAPQGARLGEWLATDVLQRPEAGGWDDLSLMWLDAAGRQKQRIERDALLSDLAARAADTSAGLRNASGLAARMTGWPVTGRLPVRRTDPWWLEVHPGEDPVLGAGDEVVMGPRS